MLGLLDSATKLTSSQGEKQMVTREALGPPPGERPVLKRGANERFEGWHRDRVTRLDHVG
jgi:hypothetical protein